MLDLPRHSISREKKEDSMTTVPSAVSNRGRLSQLVQQEMGGEPCFVEPARRSTVRGW